ncbi:PREDICTED: G-protein coupled receptor moody [Dufourea novaeangliae]|uniref:G-protein coupled receptor moody n=1 Tax=Dufourea novaeangliae TaxID=178035 RepID=A0A154NZT5_DUFNO|nr:PREDICTED: G-protein coupled receptor moody [Dufourea novaeangliae]KZC05137.1 G-protein coupled receptor moody [Dufourea novaeangliae]
MEYWMASNETGQNDRTEALEVVLQDPGSAVLFVGYPRWLLYFAAGCCVIFMVVGIPGNLFTIMALSRTRKLRNATAIFIMNLSISDLMFCCFNLPLATSTFWHSSWRHGPLLCRLFPLLRYGLVAVSLFTILAITINRYVMIGHPRLYPKLYKQKYLIPMVFSIWIVAFGVLVVTWFETWGRFGLDTAIGSCSILPDVHGRSPKEFLFVVAFLIPCIAIVVCYARIFYIVRKTACRSRKRNLIGNTNAMQVNHEQRSVSPRMQDEELSVLGSSCAPSVVCSNFSSKRATPPSNRLNCSRTPSRSAIEESLSELQAPSKESEDNEKANEIRKLSEENRDDDQSSPITGYLRVCDKTNLSFDIKIDDIPYVDERDDSGEMDAAFPLNDRETTKESTTKGGPTTARNKLERMASRASFIIESSALWVQRLNSKVSADSDRLESVRSSTTPERSVKDGQTVITRHGSRYLRNGRKSRNGNGLPPRMSNKDKKLLKMILVIFSSFLVCYLPITVTKTFRNAIDWRGLNIAGYVLIYLTTCINPVVYVIMSSEYRTAYKDVLFCRNDSRTRNGARKH